MILVQQLTAEDLREVEEALETLGVEKNRLIIEEQELSELKSELADYQEDVEDFKKVRCRLRRTLLCRCSLICGLTFCLGFSCRVRFRKYCSLCLETTGD